jgi:hypothetical protein
MWTLLRALDQLVEKFLCTDKYAIQCNPAYLIGHTKITIIEQPIGVSSVHSLILPAPKHCIFDRIKQHMSTVTARNRQIIQYSCV